MKTFGLADIILETLNPKLSEIQFAFIFGSIAKQDETANNDIGLLLISDTLTYTDIYLLPQTAEVPLGRLVNLTFYSAKEWVHKKNANNHLYILNTNTHALYISISAII